METHSHSKTWREFFSLLASICAVFVAWALFKEHLSIAEGKGLSLAFCDASPSSGCRIAALSPYAEIVTGIPTALIATGFFATSALVSVCLILDKANKWRIRESWFLFQAVAAIASAIYLFIMLTVLQVRCNGCLILHALNFTLLALRWSDFHPKIFRRSVLRLSLRRLITMATVIGALSGLILLCYPVPKPENIREFSMTVEPKTIAGASNFELTLGKGKREISLQMAIDLTCPYCKENILNLTEALMTLGYRAKVQLIIYPLDSTCNPYFEARIYESCAASRIAFCELKAGKFQAFIRKKLLEQSTLVSDLNEAVIMIDQDSAAQKQLISCASSAETESALQAQLHALASSGLSKVVNSTPTTWIFGYQLVGRLHSSEWVQLLMGRLSPTKTLETSGKAD